MTHREQRRRFFRQTLSHTARLGALTGVASVAGLPLWAQAAQSAPTAPPDRSAEAAQGAQRSLAFSHLHTGEQIDRVYAIGPAYLPEALGELNHALRDHYTHEVGEMDPKLLDLLHRLHQRLDTASPFEVISAYRCPATNDRLRRTRGGGVAKRSLHMLGQAIDIRVPHVALADLRDAALQLEGGGVGYYPRSQFVHVDTGRVRHWRG